MQLLANMRLRLASVLRSFADDHEALAATEFAIIVPVMLVMFFGTVEFSSAVAANRKVTIMARTLSDLTSQSTSVADSDMTNFFAASTAIMTPYPTTAIQMTISELYVDPTTRQARVQWSKGSMPRGTSSIVAIPSQLQIGGTYLIFSEVSYLYVPVVGYVMLPSGVTLTDSSYTRPRQSNCVFYSPSTSCTTL
jgi:Flp pilus assembly protein TadG